MPVDVFDGDRGIIDKNTDRERDAAHGHDVERFAEDGQQGNRAHDRQRR